MIDEENFDWKFYVSLYNDIKHIKNKDIALSHYKKYGIQEGRIYNKVFILSESYKSLFDWNFYVKYYKDISHVDSEKEAWNHYKNYGYKEGRFYSENKVFPLPSLENNKYSINNSKILVVMPTYNRSGNIKNIIKMMLSQNYQSFIFLIIDDGSKKQHKEEFQKLQIKYKKYDKIVFMENEKNCHIARTLNKGIKYFLDNDFSHFTWISDDNIYYPHFLRELVSENNFFKYSSFEIKELNGSISTNINPYSDLNNILNNFNGCASFMWTREAIEKIGFLNVDIPGCEDYEYLLRTFKINYNNCIYINKSLMMYIRHNDSSMEKDKDNIMKLKETIIDNFKENNINTNNTNTIKDDTTKDDTTKDSTIEENIKLSLYNTDNFDISIVMAYYNRKEQTLKTLDGFEKQYSGKYNFEVIIVDDNSNDDNRLENYIKNYSFPINLIVISKEEKGDRVNPCIAYNKGFKEAKGEIIIIQNPECFHVGDIIGHTKNNLTEKDYFSYSCYGINTKELNELVFNSDSVIYDETIKETNRQLFFVKLWTRETDTCTGNNPNLKNFDIEWYNHPIKIPTGFHYCSSIHKKQLDIITGFDERFKDGYCFDDNELILTITKKLKLQLKIIDPINIFVIHQWHERSASYNINNTNDNSKLVIKEKWNKNKLLFKIKELEIDLIDTSYEDKFKMITNFMLKNKIYKKDIHEFNSPFIYSELDKYLYSNDNILINHYSNIIYTPDNIQKFNNIPKYAFTYWDMSVLSFMHYLTLYTFTKHHPEWCVVLYYPKKRVKNKSWNSSENKIQLDTLNYINELRNLNIKIVEIDFEKGFLDIPYYLSEVIKSDLFRLKIIDTVGGIWFDMDTFWINNIEEKFKINNKSSFEDIKTLYLWYNKNDITVNKNVFTGSKVYNDSYYVFCNRGQDNNEKNYAHFCQYILFSNKNSIITKKLLNECFSNLNIDNYESIGTPMFSKIISKFMMEDNIYDWNNNFVNINTFAPFKWYQMDLLFKENQNNNINVQNSCCLHWFNGSETSKWFINIFNHKTFENIHECNFKNIFNKYIDNSDKLFLKNLQKKVSIVMAYYNRKDQFIQTINSIKKSAYKNIEIIVVDDNSSQNQRVETFIEDINKDIDIKLINIDSTQKTWINPCIAYNIGIKKSIGDIIIIQNPEVLHVYDCITYTVMNLDKNDWLSFNCYGSPNFNYNKGLQDLCDDDIFFKINNSYQGEGGNSVQNDNVGGWLNHYKNHFVAYHYLAAINRDDLLEKMDGGFDEKFKNGAGCDDDHFIKKLIYNKFIFKTSEFKLGKPFGIHLYHEKSSSVNMSNYYINRPIFDDYCKSIGFEPLNNIHIAPKSQTPLGNQLIV